MEIGEAPFIVDNFELALLPFFNIPARQLFQDALHFQVFENVVSSLEKFMHDPP